MVCVFLIFLPPLILLTIPFLCIDSNLGLVSLTLSYPGFSLTFRLVSFTVDINGIKSPPSKLLHGVPQGSVLGPLLFILYTTPLSLIISQSSVNHKLYADDTQLFLSFSADTFSEDILLLQNTITNISSWMASNVGMFYHTIFALILIFLNLIIISHYLLLNSTSNQKLTYLISSFLSSLAYLLSTGLTPWNFDSAFLSSISHSVSLIIDPFICSTRFNFMFVI